MMLLYLIKKLLHKKKNPSPTQKEKNFLTEAVALFNAKKFRESIPAWEAYLQQHPNDVDALTNLGVALSNIGREQDARIHFENAYRLDDSNMPALVNYAHVLISSNCTKQALELITKARIQAPELASLRRVYGSILFSMGKTQEAFSHQLHAWFCNFDNSRSADYYLFTATYTETDEAHLAAEHRFWAETLPPATHDIGPHLPPRKFTKNPPNIARKLRVGYWSPDFREHSVRYFFRPLLEGHNRDQVEIYLYHDSPSRDNQTDLIEKFSDHFHDVSLMMDDELAELLYAHKLDVLVELAGHTSLNRLPMLRNRFAPLQVTGIGYPPTTGLSSIDAKFIDVHQIDQNMDELYSEAPGILGQSFWCFDPKAEIPSPPPPPVLKNGFITFGCFGNIGKITPNIMACWSRILTAVPDSQLVIRAINFSDSLRTSTFEEVLAGAGIRLDRVQLKPPVASQALFTAYGEEVDIVLDTFPFNGGTTSCFATYAGVPIVTQRGRALASRMGASIMANLGLDDWVVDCEEAYVKRAIRAAQEINTLKQIRHAVRQRYTESPLGNGSLFARNVEAFYRKALEHPLKRPQNTADYTLPAQELMRRAYTALRYGQFDAGQRIASYCLKTHPHCGNAHILKAAQLSALGAFTNAASYLAEQRPLFDNPEDQFKSLVNEARFHILAGTISSAQQTIEQLQQTAVVPAGQAGQIELLLAALAALRKPSKAPFEASSQENTQPVTIQRVQVCCVAETATTFDEMRSALEKLEKPSSLRIKWMHCRPKYLATYTQTVLKDPNVDIFVCIHNNIKIIASKFWWCLLDAFQKLDLVGFHGAKAWDRLEWRSYGQAEKAGSYLVPSGEKQGYWEVHAFSQDRLGLSAPLQVIDGAFLAIHLPSVRKKSPNLQFELELDEAGTLQSEFFSWNAAQQGCLVGACAGLGIALDWRVPLNERYLGPARLWVAEKRGFDPWFYPNDDAGVWTVPLPSMELAMQTQKNFIANQR